jgi:citronellol/citronellal dehydrogenase
MEFKNKTVFVTGGSRGIGLAIALRLAREGANVAIAAKTAEPHPQLPGTIYTAADEIRAAGGQALPLLVDVRSDEQIKAAVEQTVATFGGIDILVNNASAIFLAGTLQTPMKRYDLMHQINARGTFATSQACLPYLLQSENPHIVNLSPPLNMDPAWFGHHLAYTMAKYGMSMCVLGMAEEFRHKGVGVNALWPRTTIATAAVQNLLGGDDMIRRSRTPDIMGDACYYIVRRSSRSCTGNFFIDEEVLRQEGIHDLDGYAVEPGQSLQVDLFL